MFDKIPQEMKRLNHWVCFCFEDRNGKRTKVPYNPLTGHKARSSDNSTWASFAKAKELAELLYDGIGFMFSGAPFVGIDLDNCVEDGVISDFAQNIIASLQSYTEYSPSGTGIHIICYGVTPPGGNKNSKLGIEMYSTGRYFTMTGNVLEGFTMLANPQNAINEIHERFLLKTLRQSSEGHIPKRHSLDVNSILTIASNSKQGAAFQELYRGVWQARYQSQSEADLAFCNMLAFWTGRDHEQIDTIFRNSGLMRPKWDEVHGHDTYGGITIARAITDCLQIYEPSAWFPVVDDKGKPLTKHWKNTQWLCNKLDVKFRYNMMSKRVEVTGDSFKNLTFDAMVIEMLGLCHANGFKVSKADLTDQIGRIAEENKYNPVVDHLNECLNNWDGRSRLEQLFNCFVLDCSVTQDKGFIIKLLEKWLITCVIMAFNNGSKAAQGVLILKGPQGIGKTRWLFYLLPESSWGKDGVALDPAQKDDLLKALSYWIVELGEIRASIKKEKLDRLKAFITESTDAIRVPYGRAVEIQPRTTAFLGTVNNDEFLKDETGERRYWVVAITDVRMDDSLDINQLWGEITHKAIVEKRPYWFTKEEIQKLNDQNEAYKVIPPEEQSLLDYLDWEADPSNWQKRTSSELCSLLGFPVTRNSAIGRALRRLSTRGVARPTNNMGGKYYTVPPLKNHKDSCLLDNVGQIGEGDRTDTGQLKIQ